MTDKIDELATIKASKPRMSLLPWDALVAIAEVMTFGALKYAADSWQSPPFTKDGYLDAAMRHVAKIKAGEARDPESGLLHAAHFACCAVFYLWYALHEAFVPVLSPELPQPKPGDNELRRFRKLMAIWREADPKTRGPAPLCYCDQCAESSAEIAGRRLAKKPMKRPRK